MYKVCDYHASLQPGLSVHHVLAQFLPVLLYLVQVALQVARVVALRAAAAQQLPTLVQQHDHLVLLVQHFLVHRLQTG